VPPFHWKTSLDRFRSVAFLEGLSYVMLLFTMVLKYRFSMPEPNKIVGLAHGLLFVLYVTLLLFVWIRHRWKLGEVVVAFLLSLVPFGTFFGEARWWRHK
jgi:integral membrane protein